MKKLILLFSVVTALCSGVTASGQSKAKTTALEDVVLAIEIGDAEGAMAAIGRILQDDPSDGDAIYLRAYINMLIGNNQQAIADYTTAIEGYKKKNFFALSNIYKARGVSYSLMLEYDKAIADYTQAISLKKDDPQLLIDRGQSYANKGDITASDADYNAALAIAPESTKAMIALAVNLSASSKTSEAVKMLERAVAVNPQEALAYDYLAHGWYQLGEPRKAIDNQFLSWQITQPEALGNYAYYMAAAPQYAIMKLSTIIKEDDSDFWRYVRGLSYQNGGEYSNAIADYEAISDFEDISEDAIVSFIGGCYDAMQNYPTAIEKYTQAIEISPDNTMHYFYRGNSRFKSGDIKNAAADYGKAIDLEPQNHFAYTQRGWMREKQGDYQGALSDQNMAIELNDTNSYSYLYRARAYQLLKRDAEARQDFEKILLMDTIPQNGSCRQYALIEIGKPDEAIEWMKKIVDNAPAEFAVYYDLTCVYARLNRSDEAIAALKQAFEHGFRSFGQIAQDNYMDNICNEAEFIALIEEYKAKQPLQ